MPKFVTIENDFKIPFIKKIMLAGTRIKLIGGFQDDPGKIKVMVVSIPKSDTKMPTAHVDDVYGINKDEIE